jgi:hypothetical protein
MKTEGIYQIIGGIDLELYKKKRYYYLHRLEILSFVVLILFIPILLEITFPMIRFDFNYLFIIGVFFLLTTLFYLRIKALKNQRVGGEFDVFYNKRFYVLMSRFSLVMLLISIPTVFLSSSLIEENAMTSLFRHFKSALIFLFLNSFFVLKTAFKEN